MELLDLIRRSKRVFLAGNGGSAANAIHIANDLNDVGVRAYALTANIATITAIANDYDYGEVFARQICLHGERNDLLVVFSGSGRSPNILRALWAAKVNCAMSTVAVFGAYNDHTENLSKIDLLIAEGQTMQEAEEYQLSLGHKLMIGLREGHVSADALTMVMINQYFEHEKINARCGAIEGRKIILSLNENTNAAMEHLELWLKRITGESWELQVQPWTWPVA